MDLGEVEDQPAVQELQEGRDLTYPRAYVPSKPTAYFMYLLCERCINTVFFFYH